MVHYEYTRSFHRFFKNYVHVARTILLLVRIKLVISMAYISHKAISYSHINQSRSQLSYLASTSIFLVAFNRKGSLVYSTTYTCSSPRTDHCCLNLSLLWLCHVSRMPFFYSTPSISNYNLFNFFNFKFDHSSYLKNLCKHNQI